MKIDFYLHTLEDLDDLRHNIVTYETEDKGIKLEGWDEISWKKRKSFYSLEMQNSKEIRREKTRKRFLGWVETRQIAKWEELNWMKKLLKLNSFLLISRLKFWSYLKDFWKFKKFSVLKK